MTRGAHLCAWAVTSPAREDVSDVRFRRGFHQWLRLFLLYTVVWSKHNFNNFYFWAKIKHHFNPYALIPIVGGSGSPCADQWCSDIFPKETKHTDTIFNVVRENRLHSREMFILLEINREMVTTHMEEGNHITQTLLPLLSHCCTWQYGQQLFLSCSLLVCSLYHTL